MLLLEVSVLLLLVSLFPKQASCGVAVPSDEVVPCFTDLVTSGTSVCSGNSLGNMTAVACCEGAGNTLTFNDQCLGCILVGFNQSTLSFTPDDAGILAQVDVVVRKRIVAGAAVNIQVDTGEFSREETTEINEFVAKYPVDEQFFIFTGSNSQASFPFKLSGNGNSKALEDPLTFVISMTVLATSPVLDFAVVIFQDKVDITIADLDVLVFSFEGDRGTVFTEGDEGGVIVQRNSVVPSRPVRVFVQARLYSGAVMLMDNEYAASDMDFSLGEMEEYIFEEDGDSKIQKLFSATEDTIVERGNEVIEVVLSSNEPAVRLGINISLIFITDDDDFRIGFETTEVFLSEGEIITFTLQQTNDVVGQLRGSNTAVGKPTINNVPVTAIVNSDYNYTNSTVQEMEINSTTGVLNPITFTVGSTFVDDLLEGAESFFVRLGESDVLLVGDNPNVLVTIVDSTAAIVRLTERIYRVNENSNIFMVCAEIVGAVLDLTSTLTISATVTHITTTDFFDVIFFNRNFPFSRLNNVSCINVIVINDNIREELHENFTIQLNPFDNSNEFTDLQVDETPSDGIIIDDDRYTISFVQDFRSFSENAGNQDVFLRIDGAQILTNIVAMIYDIDTGNEVGRVTFGESSSTSQTRSFSFLNPDNLVALESVRNIRLGIREMEIFAIGAVPEMTLEIIDDDVLTIDFVSSTYNYNEDHGLVFNIELRNSHEIAEDVEVFYSGDPSIQAGVVQSGVAVFSSVTFPANSPAMSLQQIDEFTLSDDDAALELNEEYQITLLNASFVDVILGMPTTVVIMDDDILTINFVSSTYNYDEDHGLVFNIELRNSHEIAQDVEVFYSGDPSIQAGVVQSGVAVFSSVTFPANSPAMSLQQIDEFTLSDDDAALELNEEYQITLLNASFVNVVLGMPTSVVIMDDDNVTVNFDSDMYSFSEIDSTTSNIFLLLSTSIAQPLNVAVVGGPGNVQFNVTFQVGQTSQMLQSFLIQDDDIALEDDEEYELDIVVSSVTDNVIAGDSADLTITDDDTVTVSFSQPTYAFSENDGETFDSIMVTLSTPIARSLFIDISAAPGMQPSSVVISGFSINSDTLRFEAFSNLTLSLPSAFITDDDVALETTESYEIMLVSSMPSMNVVLSSPSTIEINDDDDVTVMFISDTYRFSEDESGTIRLQLTRAVAQDVSVTINGAPAGNIPNVIINGPTVNQQALFVAGGSMMFEFQIQIGNDDFALENLESYMIDIILLSPPSSDSITIGDAATIEITSEDVVDVTFSTDINSFSEEDLFGSIGILINNPIAKDLEVFVFAESLPSLGVAVSGDIVNTSVIFLAQSNMIQTLTIMINDDAVALENDEVFEIMFTDSSFPDEVILGSNTRVIIVDSDDVTVAFNQPLYTFSEDDGKSSGIAVVISNEIAQSLSIEVFADPGEQPDTVESSGFTANFTITFQPNLFLSQILPGFNITDDEIGLESVEMYLIELLSSDGSSDNVILDSDSYIQITDDDVVTIGFSRNFDFTEGQSPALIEVTIDRVIYMDISVSLLGESMPQFAVVNNGPKVNTTLIFSARGNPSMFLNLAIAEDFVAWELNEVYSIALTGTSLPAVISATSGTTLVTIFDNDVASIGFVEEQYQFLEKAGLTEQVAIALSGEIARDLIITVFGDTFPLGDGIVDSGTTVNETITFKAFNTTVLGNIVQFIPVEIIDDEVSGEPNQMYDLEIVYVPPGILVSRDTTTIVIDDDDQSGIKFLPFSGLLLESAGMYNLTVILNGLISADVYVDVIDDNGDIVETVVFSPMADVDTQEIMVTVYFEDDEIALEDSEIIGFALNNSIGAMLIHPYIIDLIVRDDDIVIVEFVQSSYNYTENHGEVTDIQVQLSNEIANNLTVSISGGPAPQPSTVIVSGVEYSDVLLFPAGTGALTPQSIQSFMITDDEVGLETLEQYQLSFVGASRIIAVILGAPTTISITDEDDVTVGFAEDQVFFSEGAGIRTVSVNINRAIATGFDVRVSGVTTPLLPGVSDSGSDVDEDATFIAQGNSFASISLNITDDDVSGEPTQQYSLSLSNEPDTVTVTRRTIDININDNDQAGVRFLPFVGPLFESAGAYNLTVMLDGEISSSVSVSVLNGLGNIASIVTFQPIQGQTSQQVIVTITFDDDEIALEEDEILQFSLNGAINSIINEPSQIQVVVMDDDRVMIMFTNQTYQFEEGEMGNIGVVISNGIAQNLTVTISGASTAQPGFVSNGPTINIPVTFSSNDGPQVITLPITIGDDLFGLESIESYSISILNTNFVQNVDIGAPADILVMDNDIITVAFTNDQHNFVESDGTGMISVSIDGPIINDLVVDVFGESLPTSGVVVSGDIINTTVTFIARGSTSATFLVTINNDDVGFENDEMFEIAFTESVPSNGVILGANTQVIISDDDVVTVGFDESDYFFNENNQSGAIALILNREIAQDFSVDVIGSISPSPFVTPSGIPFNSTVLFTASGPTRIDLTLMLQDDDNALEDLENFLLNLENPSSNSVVSLSSATAMISDDDVVVVTFSSLNNEFQENEGLVFVGVQIDKTVLKDLSVSIFGESTPIDGVVISGETVDATVLFEAQGAMFKMIPVSIQDDTAGNENDETFPLAFVSSNPSAGVDLGESATVTIIDDDNVRVDFEMTMYSFNENDGTVSVTLVLNRPVAEEVTVTVVGGPTDSSFITSSAPYINQTVTFTPNGSLTINVTFTLQNDEDGLEDPELFTLSLEDPEMQNIDVSSVTNVEILDDDVVRVSFVPIDDPISEDVGSQPVGVQINRNIVRDLVVEVLGVSPDQDGVTQSGQPVATNVTFVAGDVDTVFFNVGITNDDDALENMEQYELTLTSSTPMMNVELDPNMIITIRDEDDVIVTFASAVNSGSESSSSISVVLTINNRILTPFTIDVVGDPYPQPSTVVISGSRVEQRGIMFNESIRYQTVMVALSDDNVALEDDEEFFLTFENPSSSRVTAGNDTLVRITDDDEFTFGPSNQNVIYPENGGNQVFTINFSPSVRNQSFFVSTSLISQDSSKLNLSLDSIDCGQDDENVIELEPSLVPVQIACYVVINDDDIAHEDDEVYNLTILLLGADPTEIQSMTLTIVDDDVAQVVTDVSQRNVTEGGDSIICVRLNTTSVRETTVVLTTTDRSATDGDDFISGGEKTVVIPAGSTDIHCANYSTLIDNDIEGDEDFDIEITRVSLSDPPMTIDPKSPTIGPQSSTTIVILDIPPESRTCIINSSSQTITTFGDTDTYMYNRTCEHALLLQQSTLGEFGVFVESLDGTFMTTRVGVRIGSNESIVVNAYNRTIIRQTTLNEIRVSSTTNKLTIAVASLDFVLEISASRIAVSIGANSSLQTHTGLCGNVNGDLVLRNGSVVDADNDMAALNKLIGQNMVPPSETFVRMVTRQECGLTGTDLETGDPMFIVPLYTPSEQEAHSYSLCYEIHGYKDETYNFISDECTQVYGHYYETTDPDPDVWRRFHGVDRIDIRTVNNLQQCVSISVVLDLDNKVCSTSVGGSSLGSTYSKYGVSVRQMTVNRTMISVPNCADNRLKMYVICQDMNTAAPYLELKVVRGLNLRESSHGIIGQFWNVETSVTQYTQPLRDGTIADNAYLVELMPKNKPKRSFIGFLYQNTWNFERFPCIYAGNAQGGPIYEAADGEPNDSLIEGSISDYTSTDFNFNQFDESRC